MFGNCQRFTMDKPIPKGTGNEHKNPNLSHGQRSCIEVKQDSDFPPSNSAHRAPVPLYTGTSGSKSHPNNWNKRQGQPSGPTNETPSYGCDWAMETAEFNWLDEIDLPNNMFWVVVRNNEKVYKGLKTRGYTEEGSPLGDVDIGMRTQLKSSERERVLEALLAKVMNQGRGSKTAGCNKAWMEWHDQ